MAPKVTEGCQLPSHVVKVDSFNCQSTNYQQLKLKHCDARLMQRLSTYCVQNSLSKVEECWNVKYVEWSLVKGISQQLQAFYNKQIKLQTNLSH